MVSLSPLPARPGSNLEEGLKDNSLPQAKMPRERLEFLRDAVVKDLLSREEGIQTREELEVLTSLMNARFGRFSRMTFLNSSEIGKGLDLMGKISKDSPLRAMADEFLLRSLKGRLGKEFTPEIVSALYPERFRAEALTVKTHDGETRLSNDFRSRAFKRHYLVYRSQGLLHLLRDEAPDEPLPLSLQRHSKRIMETVDMTNRLTTALQQDKSSQHPFRYGGSAGGRTWELVMRIEKYRDFCREYARPR
ncbi:MAG: hypothetical protein KDD64_12985 [Bdellovibrionales bacterium]|nr:hypothetical protein [Bdellovibrionales bacterium]